MKAFVSRVLKGKQFNAEQPRSPESAIQPKTIESLKDHQRLSIVSWVANKLGSLTGLNGADEGCILFDAPIKGLSTLDLNKEEDYLLYLADKLVSWIENNEDVYFNIREMDLKDIYHKKILEVYELIKSDETLYFNRKSQEEKVLSEEDKIWEVYRDVLHAASSRKFLLIRDEELSLYLEGKVICDEPVVEKSDIPIVRNKAKESMIADGVDPSKISGYILLISEAITNVLKHAKDGRLLITKTEKSLNILIMDKGSGFPLKILPYTLLMPGYSTKKSLGQGFTLMMKLATKVLLKTSSEGSTIVLNFEEDEGEKNGEDSREFN